jgi:hypothetical protein
VYAGGLGRGVRRDERSGPEITSYQSNKNWDEEMLFVIPTGMISLASTSSGKISRETRNRIICVFCELNQTARYTKDLGKTR